MRRLRGFSSVPIFKFLTIAIVIAGFIGCSNSPTGTGSPVTTNSDDDTGIIRGTMNPGDVQFEFISSGDDGSGVDGRYAIRGRNIQYDATSNALTVDLSVINLSDKSYDEPVILTFLSLLPNGVTVENSDNGLTGAGAAIEFKFMDPSASSVARAAGDGTWDPQEESLPRNTSFGVNQGISIGFVARIDAGMGGNGLGAIGGMVWDDHNEDGNMDDGEAGIEGVGIVLLKPDGSREDTHTDSGGSYKFEDLDEGLYKVTKLVGDGLTATTPTMLQVVLVENDGTVAPFLAANFGCKRDSVPATGAIGGTVYDDANGNGMLDDGEMGMAGVKITLIMDPTNGTPSASNPISVETGMDGKYVFGELGAGTYLITKTPPDGYVTTTDNPLKVTLMEGQRVDGVDFGCRGEVQPQ